MEVPLADPRLTAGLRFGSWGRGCSLCNGKSARLSAGTSHQLCFLPRIACSTPFGVLCYCMLWSTLADGAPASLKFLWYLFSYNFFQICMTVRDTRFLSWGCRTSSSAAGVSRPQPLLRGSWSWVWEMGSRGWGDGAANFSAGQPVYGDTNLSIAALLEKQKKRKRGQKATREQGSGAGAGCGGGAGEQQPELSARRSPQCYHVPYSSLTMFLGGTQRDRDSATAYSKCPCPYSPETLPRAGGKEFLSFEQATKQEG